MANEFVPYWFAMVAWLSAEGSMVCFEAWRRTMKLQPNPNDEPRNFEHSPEESAWSIRRLWVDEPPVRDSFANRHDAPPSAARSYVS